MTARLASVLLAMSPRERWLLAGLFALVLPVAILFLWLVPLSENYAQARTNLQTAQDMHQWVSKMAEQDAALRRLEPEQNGTTQAAIGISGIEESLKQAGLRQAVTQLARRDAGAITLRFEAVDFTQLAQWLDASKPVWGYRIDSFQFERSQRAGLVAAELLLEVAQ